MKVFVDKLGRALPVRDAQLWCSALQCRNAERSWYRAVLTEDCLVYASPTCTFQPEILPAGTVVGLTTWNDKLWGYNPHKYVGK